MNMFSKIALTGLALSLSSFASAAVSGSTDFRVILPEILVLYHWDDVVLNLTADSIAKNDSTLTRTGTTELGTTTATIDSPAIDTSANADILSSSIRVTLKDAWAVRNLSNTNGVELQLTNPNPRLISTVDQTSSLNTSGAILESASDKIIGSKTAPTLNILSGWAPVTGDIIFDLDLSNANSAGEYNTRGASGTSGAGAVGSEATDSFVLTLTSAAAP